VHASQPFCPLNIPLAATSATRDSKIGRGQSDEEAIPLPMLPSRFVVNLHNKEANATLKKALWSLLLVDVMVIVLDG